MPIISCILCLRVLIFSKLPIFKHTVFTSMDLMKSVICLPSSDFATEASRSSGELIATSCGSCSIANARCGFGPICLQARGTHQYSSYACEPYPLPLYASLPENNIFGRFTVRDRRQLPLPDCCVYYKIPPFYLHCVQDLWGE